MGYRNIIIFSVCPTGIGNCYTEHSVFNMDLFFGIGFQLISMAIMSLMGSIFLIFIEMNSRRFVQIADSISIKKLFSCSKDTQRGMDALYL